MSSATDAFSDGLNCASCDDEVVNIIDLLDHDCDQILSAEDLTSHEKSTLLYIEARIVDGQAQLNLSQMNYEDQQNMKLLTAAGLFDAEEDPVEPVVDVVKFTDEAWDLAAECRKLRGEKNLRG